MSHRQQLDDVGLSSTSGETDPGPITVPDDTARIRVLIREQLQSNTKSNWTTLFLIISALLILISLALSIIAIIMTGNVRNDVDSAQMAITTTQGNVDTTQSIVNSTLLTIELNLNNLSISLLTLESSLNNLNLSDSINTADLRKTVDTLQTLFSALNDSDSRSTSLLSSQLSDLNDQSGNVTQRLVTLEALNRQQNAIKTGSFVCNWYPSSDCGCTFTVQSNVHYWQQIGSLVTITGYDLFDPFTAGVGNTLIAVCDFSAYSSTMPRINNHTGPIHAQGIVGAFPTTSNGLIVLAAQYAFEVSVFMGAANGFNWLEWSFFYQSDS